MRTLLLLGVLVLGVVVCAGWMTPALADSLGVPVPGAVGTPAGTPLTLDTGMSWGELGMWALTLLGGIGAYVWGNFQAGPLQALPAKQRILAEIIAGAVGWVYRRYVAPKKAAAADGKLKPGEAEAAMLQAKRMVKSAAVAAGIADHHALSNDQVLEGMIQAEVARQKGMPGGPVTQGIEDVMVEKDGLVEGS